MTEDPSKSKPISRNAANTKNGRNRVDSFNYLYNYIKNGFVSILVKLK